MLRAWTPPIVLALAFAACEDDAPRVVAPDEDPPTARWDQVEAFRADLAAPRHPSDGGGTTRIVDGPRVVRVGAAARWTLELVVGEHGIAEGGTITLMPEPFWGWSTPQAMRDELPGFTSIEAEGVAFSPVTIGGAEAGMMIATVESGALEAGDVVRIVYGAGERGAHADRHAGRGARIWVGVDGDGDGVRKLIDDSPTVDVEAREPERLVLVGPSVVAPGETARFHVSALDGWANRAPRSDEEWSRAVRIDGAPAGWQCPDRVELNADGFASFEVVAGDEDAGAVRLVASFDPFGEGPVRAVANPLVVDGLTTPIRWADLHGHSGLSDGTGEPVDYFTYARDTARLDAVALTDHDHFGSRFIDAYEELRAGIADVTESFHDPGAFVAVHGFEWTNWVHGHRHVLSFTDSIEWRSSIDEQYDTPAELWDSLRGTASMTIAHHSSGQPIPVNWTYAPDPVLEPVTEIVSVHGSSEARDAPMPVRGSRDGRFVRDQLVGGLRLGFIGSGDSHDGHPGLAHLSPIYGWRSGSASRPELSGTAGLAAVRAPELTRAALLDALRARACYATNGPRIVVLEREPGSRERASLRVHGTAPLASLDVVSGDSVVRDVTHAGRVDFEVDFAFERGAAFGYVRIVQQDGGVAWVGPWF